MFLTPSVAADGAMLWGLKLAYEGPVGVAKTAKISAVGRDLGLSMILLRASSMDPTDATGLLVPQVDDQGIMWSEVASPGWVRETRLRPSMVFCDEFTAGTSEATMAALLDVVQSHKVGNVKCGPQTRFVVAHNPEFCTPGGIAISPAMANRLIHLKVHMQDGRVSVDPAAPGRWADWFMGHDDTLEVDRPIDSEATARLADLERDVLERWPDAFREARVLVGSFVTHVTGMVANVTPGGQTDKTGILESSTWLNIPTDPSKPEYSGSFPTSRSLDTVARVIAGARIHGLTETQEAQLIVGAIGTPWGQSFQTFRSNMDIPAAADFIGGDWETHEFDHRVDRTFTVLMGATRYVLTRPDPLDREDAVIVLLRALLRAADQAGDDMVVKPLEILHREGGLTPIRRGFKGPGSLFDLRQQLIQRTAGFRERT